jgi:hypothetical protein
MEKSLQLCDFETVDQTVQVHGELLPLVSIYGVPSLLSTDYAGVSVLAGRDANAKNAAAETSSTFSSHYPELLVGVAHCPTLMR